MAQIGVPQAGTGADAVDTSASQIAAVSRPSRACNLTGTQSGPLSQSLMAQASRLSRRSLRCVASGPLGASPLWRSRHGSPPPRGKLSRPDAERQPGRRDSQRFGQRFQFGEIGHGVARLSGAYQRRRGLCAASGLAHRQVASFPGFTQAQRKPGAKCQAVRHLRRIQPKGQPARREVQRSANFSTVSIRGRLPPFSSAWAVAEVRPAASASDA